MTNLKPTTNLATNKISPKNELKGLVQKMEGEIKKALPKTITPERFTRIVLSAISNSPKLASCSAESFLGAMMSAAQLGLEPNTPLGHAYLIPYKTKYGDKVQFQIGYKGLLNLAYRSGEIKTIMAQTVYENDTFDYCFGLEPNLEHKPAKANRGKPIFYYAVYKLKNGGEGFEVMSVDDVLVHAKGYSKSYNDGPWVTNFDEMAKKTVLKKALKYAPLASDFVNEVAMDESVKSSIAEDMALVPNDVIDITEEVTEQETQTTNEMSIDDDPTPTTELKQPRATNKKTVAKETTEKIMDDDFLSGLVDPQESLI